MAERDGEWLNFSAVCNDLRHVKSLKSVSSAVDKLQVFLSDDRNRQLVHRWRSWGYLLISLLHVIKEEMRAYLDLGSTGRKRKIRPKIPQLRYWHYLRTELETAHVAADGPMLHLDPNGRDCIRQLFSFSVAVIDRQTAIEFDQNFETLVDKEAWLTVEVLVQYRVYCAVLDYKDWKNMLQLALGSISPKFDDNLIGDIGTAATRARVTRYLVRNYPCDLKSEMLLALVVEIEAWFKAGNCESMEREADSLLLVIASTLLETLTDLIRAHFSSIGPYLLKRGVTILDFIVKSNKVRKKGLRGAPAEFLISFLELYQHHVCAKPEFCYLPPLKLLREMKKLIQIATRTDELNHMTTHFNSVREERLGNALGFDDHGIRHLACITDIIFSHDCLVSDLMQASSLESQEEDLCDPSVVGSKRVRSISHVLAWETLVEQLLDSPRTESESVRADTFSPASQQKSSTFTYLSRNSSQAPRTDTKQVNDSGSSLLLLLSILSRHGDYYILNRIGDIMMIMHKLNDSLIAKRIGKWQALILQILIQLAALSARHRKVCHCDLNEHWTNIWQNLLRPELPYIQITEGIGLMRGETGDAVLTLLNCCISFQLVSINAIESHSKTLWNLPAFGPPSGDGSAFRGDRIKSCARTSVASICIMLALLHHLQIPPAGTNLPAVTSEGPNLFSLGENSFTNHDLKLIQSLFDHLQAQVFQTNASMAGNLGNSYTKVDWQTEVSSFIYASVIDSFFGLKSPFFESKDVILTPDLIRKLSARTVSKCEGSHSGEEFNGFGIAFCMLDTGLEYLSVDFTDTTTGVKPDSFPLPFQALTGKYFGASDVNWCHGVESCADDTEDQFERLAVPKFFKKLIVSQDNERILSYRCFPKEIYTQSISIERSRTLQTKVNKLFTGLLSEITSNLPSKGCNPVKGLRILANSLDVGLVLAALYVSRDESSSSIICNENRLCVAPLLKIFFDLIADYLTPSFIKQAHHSQSMSESVLHTLRKLQTILLVLQGKQKLEKCRHPSADPIAMRTPPELRPSLTTIVRVLEESLDLLCGGVDTANNTPTSILPRQRTGFKSRGSKTLWESKRRQSLPSQGQLTVKEWDIMDEKEENDVTRDRPSSRVIQKSVGLWCFRVILLLEKDSGLSSVKKHVVAIQFDPDFVLAVAALLCGVIGSSSLEAFITLIDYAAEEGMRDQSATLNAKRKSPRAAIFLSQVLSVLLLAGLVYEGRHREHGEQIPVILTECARRHLNSMSDFEMKLSLRMTRRVELQCLEVFFRHNSHEFMAYEEACVQGLTDSDISVRCIAARGLQTLYFMFPEGGEEIFQHFLNVQKKIIDIHEESINQDEDAVADCGGEQQKRDIHDVVTSPPCINTFLTMLLSLYISACSSQTALPEALSACVDMASTSKYLYGFGKLSLISQCLEAIAEFYGYANVSNLLEEHFCTLWHRYVAASYKQAPKESEGRAGWILSNSKAPLPDGLLLLQQFPLSILIGEVLDSCARRMKFEMEIDVIIPIGVLHNFISASSVVENDCQFEFVNELLSGLLGNQLNERHLMLKFADIDAQLTTDLLAFSFILFAHSDPKLKLLAQQMRVVAEKRALVPHLGHVVVSKMARFMVWKILEKNGDELKTQCELMKGALQVMRESCADFDWRLINTADLLCEFDVLLTRSEKFDPRAECAVDCFSILVVETRYVVAENPILQHLLISICFKAIKHLAIRNRRRISGVLALLIRESCECFLKDTEMFGKYVNFVVQEISYILSKCKCNSPHQLKERKLSLNADDRTQLEWIIYSVCSSLESGQSKYALDIDIVPYGVAASLDKLNALLLKLRTNIVSTESLNESDKINKLSHTRETLLTQGEEQMRYFIQREQLRGTKFNSPFFYNEASFLAISTSIKTLRDSSRTAQKLYGSLAHTLLYLSLSGTPGYDTCNRVNGSLKLADALGELGALDTSEYELSSSEQEKNVSRLYRKHFCRGALHEILANYPAQMHESVLTFLSSIFLDISRAESGDPIVLEVALRTVKSVLNVKEGVAALARSKDIELKSFLEPFVFSKPSNWSAAAPSCSQGHAYESKRSFRYFMDLWTSAVKRNFESWVCSLTACLTRESKDPVLRSCSALCALRTDMSIFLFPYALDSILRNSNDEKMLNVDSQAGEAKINIGLQVWQAANEGVRFILACSSGMNINDRHQSALNESQPLQAIQLVVHSINFLRETEKARFVESNGRYPQDLSASKGARSRRLRSTGSSLLRELPNIQYTYGCLIDVNLLLVAKAAILVKMPYSAMQYIEMWVEKQQGGKITSLSTLESNAIETDIRDLLVEAYSFDCDDDGLYGINDGRTIESQLVKYNREGEYVKVLSLYDVSLQFANQQPQIYKDEMSSHPPPHLVHGMLTSLHALGYNHLLKGYLQSLQQNDTMGICSSASSQALEHIYNRSWMNMQWDEVLPQLSSPNETCDSPNTKHQPVASFYKQRTIFQSLRALAHGNFTHLFQISTNAKKQILQSIQLSLHSFESTKDFYEALAHFQAIHEIEELATFFREFKVAQSKSIIATTATIGLRPSSSQGDALVYPHGSLEAMPLLKQWQLRREQIKNDFGKADSLLALEEVLVQIIKPSDSDEMITSIYLDLASLSRKAGRPAVAYRALLKLEQLCERGSLSIYETALWQIEKAKLLWNQQEPRSAIYIGKKELCELTESIENSTLSQEEISSLKLLQVKALTITGKWITSQRSESSQTILENYFRKATEIVDNIDTKAVSYRSKDAAKAHFTLADFMSAMYQQVSSRVTSREWLAGNKVVQARDKELRELQLMEKSMQHENRAHIHTLHREVEFDLNERSKVENSVDQFLIGALGSYAKGLTLSSHAELDKVFRVLSLWLNNQRKADINRVFIEQVIDLVPSYKFVPLSYQIISRISSSSDASTFQTALRKLVMKLSVQHPHHTLVQLIALKNSGDVEGKGALQFRANVGDAKAEGAKVYLSELMKTEQHDLLESLDTVASAYVQLALFNTSEYHNQKIKIPLSVVTISGIHSGRSGATTFDQCLRVRARRGGSASMPAVLTTNIAPQADMDYSTIARMLSFEPKFSITDSGIHRPKIIYCYGSDGNRYKQLVKGQDDTRQDLVIEQVFETMNQFLMEDKATRNRKLRLRTYRVVPLSPIAGVLEWVENTVPWGSYLVNRTSKRLSAHERYHPHEWKHMKCRQYLKNAPDKLSAYLEIQKNFTPVFHHFFLEMFPDAAVWYRRRSAYVQSAAVTSIVGYILGIGDRHSQNILIHEVTGELVHIDFGVVFDQGMALFTPETVPFRLTRDMVDGMGISGVDGVFTRCCEVTLQLLRKKSASVVTILEVFVHDPLYRWTLSPLKALRIQGGGEKETRTRSLSRSSSSLTEAGSPEDADVLHAEPGSTDAAARALIRVKQKLEGYEDPNGSALSIEGQVKQLISIAQDPQNLCKLFPGWAPWL